MIELDDDRLIAISNLLADYASGNFDSSVDITTGQDELDSIIMGVNMLGEELKTTTISNDFFTSIYNAATEMIFVLDGDLNIKEVNESVITIIQTERGEIVGKKLSVAVKPKKGFIGDLRTFGDLPKKRIDMETTFRSNSGAEVPVICTFSKISNPRNIEQEFLLVAKDITEKQEMERAALRMMAEVQEQERKRVAYDLHDSLGQELATVKMIFTSLLHSGKFKDKTVEGFLRGIELLDSSVDNLRSICFDLLPVSLEKHGLIKALHQLNAKLNKDGQLDVVLDTELENLDMSMECEVAIYRVYQEFVNNSLKHSKASLIQITIRQESESILITIEDNGIGFDMNNIKSSGRGLNTMKTRVESFGGEFEMSSIINEGTKVSIIFNSG